MAILKTIMTRTEYLKWLSFHVHKQPDTLELQIATLTSMVAAGLGVKNVTAEDYLIHKPRKVGTADTSEVDDRGVMSSDEVQAFFGMIAEPLE